MKLVANNIVKGKFWDIKVNGKKVGFLEANQKGYTFKVVNILPKSSERFASLSALKKTHDIEFKNQPLVKKVLKEEEEFLVYGYPVKVKPFNQVFDIRQNLPLFTKASKSRSYYCAGYYIIKFEGIGWTIANNPKLITINRYPYRGPFLTLEQAKALRDDYSKVAE